MRCPACRAELVVVEREGVELDWCPFCRGLWFDAGELAALAATLGVEVPALEGERGAGKRACPRCDAALDTLRLVKPAGLVLDLCPGGHGVWFDAGELAALTAAGAGGTPGDVVAFFGEKLRRKS
jgi:Zn-finger nucleic acid-binding protein